MRQPYRSSSRFSLQSQSGTPRSPLRPCLLQADVTAGRVDSVGGMGALLLLDVANAFGTLRLDKALAALRKYLPELVRWFSIQHESHILLLHAGSRRRGGVAVLRNTLAGATR